MADYNSELPIRSQLPGQVNPDDVIVKLGDATNPATQQAKVDANGSQYSVIADASGHYVTTEANGAQRALDVMTQASGSATGGTAASFSELSGGIYNSTPITLTNGQQASLQLTSSGALIVSATVTFPYDTNYGTVDATTLRTAAQIGNATGAANFNYGTVGAQTLRVASQIGNATGAADFGAGATDAQTLRVASNLYDSSGNAISSTAGALNVNATQGTSPWITKDVADGSVTGGTAGTFSQLAGGVYNSTPPTLTTGQQAALQLDSAGRLLVDANITFPYDTNYGVVGATTLRTAAQIGNATGAANFNYGAVGAQTLRVASQIGNATGAADFGAGATDAQTLRVASNLYDGSGNAISSTAGALNVNATQGTSPWITKDQADGPVTPGTVASFSQLAGGQYNSTPPTLTTGQQAALQLDSAGRLLVDANVIFPYDENYGTVGVNTLRTASQIGNATGAADFNWGVVGAQTLRVAAEIGNSTGAADFNAGATGAQTLRVVANQGAPNTAANAWPIAITSGGAVNSPTNPVFVSQSDIPGTAVDHYTLSASVAKNASVNVDYTVTAGKTFYTKQHYASASGLMKIEVQYETAAGSGTFNSFWVGFNSTADSNILIPVPTAKSQVAGARIRYILTNLDKAAMDLYSTLSGIEQ